MSFILIVLQVPYSEYFTPRKIMLSEAFYEDVRSGKYPGLMAVEQPQAMEFDREGNLKWMLEL